MGVVRISLLCESTGMETHWDLVGFVGVARRANSRHKHTKGGGVDSRMEVMRPGGMMWRWRQACAGREQGAASPQGAGRGVCSLLKTQFARESPGVTRVLTQHGPEHGPPHNGRRRMSPDRDGPQEEAGGRAGGWVV